MKTLVVGLGNPILTDDGVGVKVAYRLSEILPSHLRSETTVTEASVGGLRLMELMINYDRAIIIDALIQPEGNQPGKIRRMTLDDLKKISPTQHSASAHNTTLVTALETGKQLGFTLPEEVIIYAIEVENVLDFSERPTDAVADVIPKVTNAVLAELTMFSQVEAVEN
jgi:hydrogenase maturation protease